MQRFLTILRLAPLKAACICAAGILLDGCQDFEESGLPGSAASMARNQMMLVRKEPPSFGYYRLSSQKRIYPDLAIFLEGKGTPDFLAETNDQKRNYFILYYLAKREAFACRTHPERSQAMEFSGPYPITRKEYQTLAALGKPADP
jgi:hypothetical protein